MAQDPFAPIGGGVQLAGGEWVPKDHPLAKQAKPQEQSANGGGLTPAQPAATNIGDQSDRAQTYSGTPGAAPTANTTNQGTQDVVRNTYLQQATQGTKVDTNDPNIRQQVDPYAAAVQRQKTDYLADQAEKLGPYATGAMRGQERMASERAGQAIGSFESQLVGRELQNRRNEIQNALASLGGMINSDQGMQLQREMAELDAELKRLGINTGASTAAAELALKDRLGTGGLNVDMMRLLLQNQQFGNELGFNIADREAFWNNQALQSLF